MRKILFLFFCLCCLGWAETRLGSWYIVLRDNSDYVAESGDKTIYALNKDTLVRLIKDETVAETVMLLPFRVLKLMFTVEPRGNWLVEDIDGNRGYMWDSDLALSSDVF